MKKYRIEKRQKTNNPIAKDLRTPKYRERVVHPKRYRDFDRELLGKDRSWWFGEDYKDEDN